MIQFISFLIPALFLYIYIILSSIEFGSAIVQLFPNIAGGKINLKKYIQPVWEVTNVFLVFTIISLFTFFPGATYYFGTNLLVPVFIGLIFLGLRALCMMLIFYGNIQNIFVNILFLITSFLAPITLSNAYIYILTGRPSLFFTSLLSISLDLIIIFSIILISGSFFRFTRLMRIAPIGFLFSTILFVFLLTKQIPDLFLHAKTVIAWISIWIISYLLFLALQNYRARFIAACISIGTLYGSVAALHLPYVIYPNITIYNSFMDPSLYLPMTISLVIGMILVIPALLLLYFLFRKKNSNVVK